MLMKYGELGDTIAFHYAVNDTGGSAVDGSGFSAQVRLFGAASSAAPVHSPTCTLLSHASYPAGCYEISIAATTGNGYADNSEYAVFVTGTADAETPVAYVGSFQLGKLQTAADLGQIYETTIATLSTQTSFTLTAGSDQDDAYNNLMMVIEDADNTTRRDPRVYASDYTGSTRTVTLAAGTTGFSAAVGDRVRIFAVMSPTLLGTAAAIAAVSAKLPTALTSGGAIKADVYSVNEVEVTGAGTTGDEWGPV
jgi:hypothetical protein